MNNIYRSPNDENDFSSHFMEEYATMMTTNVHRYNHRTFLSSAYNINMIKVNNLYEEFFKLYHFTDTSLTFSYQPE